LYNDNNVIELSLYFYYSIEGKSGEFYIIDWRDKPHPKKGMGGTESLRYENKICPPPPFQGTSPKGGQKLKLQNTSTPPSKRRHPSRGEFLFNPPPPFQGTSSKGGQNNRKSPPTKGKWRD